MSQHAILDQLRSWRKHQSCPRYGHTLGTLCIWWMVTSLEGPIKMPKHSQIKYIKPQDQISKNKRRKINTYSGSTYPKVPITMVDTYDDSLVFSFAIPKSPTLAFHLLSSKMLLLFTSRWIMEGLHPLCKYSKPVCKNRHIRVITRFV